MSTRRLATAIAFAASFFSLVHTDAARATDAYWHGVRSDVWSDGIAAGQSNWYSEAPPGGVARNVPTSTAIFAPGAMRFNLLITAPASIARMRFTADAPLYTFRVARNRSLTLNGLGLINQSPTAPRFTVLQSSEIFVNESARLASGSAVPSARITTVDGGSLEFRNTSRGGNAEVFNTSDGFTTFLNSSSAERMTITNRTGGAVVFGGRSTGDRAHIINEPTGLLNCTLALGPASDERLPIGKVDNSGLVEIETIQLIVGQTFTQTAQGTLSLVVSNNSVHGAVETTQGAKLDGTLRVEVRNAVTPGTFKIIRTGGLRTGRFAQLDFQVPSTLKARLAYSPKEVALIVENK